MCGACNNQVNTSNHNIKCDFCDRRYHVYCSRDELILVEFMNTSCLWICSDCGLPSFSSSLLDSPNIAETSNSFSAIGSSASSTSAWDMSLDPSDCTIHSKDLPSISTPINHRQRQKVNHKIKTINCRSLRSDSKRSAFTALVDTYKPDIINATETHLDSSVFSAELGLDNYDVFCKDRNIHGGGVLIAVKNNLIASRELELEREELETVLCKLQISRSKMLYNCCFYRKPDHHKEPIEHLDETIANATSNTNVPCIVVTGDFNLPHIDWDLEDCKSKYTIKENPQYGTAENQALLDLAHQHSLSQCVKEPARGNNILDLVFTNNPDLVENSEVIAGMSDHDIVITDPNLEIQPSKKKQRKVFFYKKANVEALKNNIQQSLNDLAASAAITSHIKTFRDDGTCLG